jgi:hypothetical protein
MSTTIRIPLVGRLHSLSLTSQDVSFRLRCDHHGDHCIEYRCHSNRPEVITTAATLELGQLVGIIAVAPKGNKLTGLHVERLELLGRKMRKVTA